MLIYRRAEEILPRRRCRRYDRPTVWEGSRRQTYRPDDDDHLHRVSVVPRFILEKKSRTAADGTLLRGFSSLPVSIATSSSRRAVCSNQGLCVGGLVRGGTLCKAYGEKPSGSRGSGLDTSSSIEERILHAVIWPERTNGLLVP